jgi:hypothetical protein
VHATIAALSIAEHLQSGPRTAEEVAKAESADPDALFRLMRLCVALAFSPSTLRRVASAARGCSTRSAGMARSVRTIAPLGYST